MAKLSTAKIVGMLASAKKTGKQVLNSAGEWVAEIVEDFVSGFTGHGWKIWEYVKGLWRLEIDSIVVRGTMTVFELLIQKIRAVKGALGITQACGKIQSAGLDDNKENWLITIEDEMSFVGHDIIRCQSWTGNGIKGYWVEISEIRKIDGVDTIVVPVSEFTGGIGYVDGMEMVKPDLLGMTTPVVGDEIIQFGNSQNTNRQSAIYLHADEGGQPAIDILFGIKSKSFAGCVKQRIGGDIPGTDGLKGFYCENGMIKGVDETGHMVYCIHPDGSAEFGDGSAKFNTDKSGFIAGGAISWEWNTAKKKFVCTMGDVILKWDNLSDEVKENLKGEPGKNGTDGTDGKDGTDGVPGPPGADGKVYYTWIRYANDVQGNGISNDPTGKSFIGLAYNKETAVESNTASDYSWSRFRGFDGSDGKDGTDGVPGPPGADGKPTYTWIAYSDNADGSNMYQIPTDETKYIGIAVNKDTATESNRPSDYTWSLFRGEDAVMYVIEFYIQGLQVHNIACDIHSKPIAGSTLVAKLFRIKGSTKQLYSAGRWVVNHWLNGTETSDMDYSSPRSTLNIEIVNVGSFDSVSVDISGGSNPDDPEISASGIIAKVMANVPDWLTGWDTNKVMIGSNYMISPKLFTGVNTGTAAEPILTGIVQGDKCITIDEVERSGIFALAENEIIFELDAVKGTGSLAKGTTSWDKFGQTYRKTRDIIVWRRLSDEMQAILDKIEDPEEERPDEYDLNLEYGTYLMAHNPTLNFFVNLPDPAECKGLILDVYDMPRTRALIYWAKFRCKISPILRRNSTGAYEAVVVSDPGRKEFGSSIIQSVQYNDSWRWIADSSFEVVNVTTNG